MHKKRKKKKKVLKEAWENLYASLTYFWDLYNGNVNPIRIKSVE